MKFSCGVNSNASGLQGARGVAEINDNDLVRGDGFNTASNNSSNNTSSNFGSSNNNTNDLLGSGPASGGVFQGSESSFPSHTTSSSGSHANQSQSGTFGNDSIYANQQTGNNNNSEGNHVSGVDNNSYTGAGTGTRGK